MSYSHNKSVLVTFLCSVYFFFSGITLLAQQSNVFLNIDQDAVLYETADGSRGNSLGEYLFVGKDGEGDIKRSLLRVDLGEELPSDATIDSVFLLISLNKTRNDEQPLRGYQVLARWIEGSSNAAANEGKGTDASAGDPTWTHRVYPDTLWNQEGGDYGEDILFDGIVDGSGTYSLKATASFIALMEAWLRNETPNNGFILIGNEEVENGSSKRFASRQFSGSANKPSLSVYFTPQNSTSDESLTSLPENSSLHPNYPNPFNPSTTLSFTLASPDQVELSIYNSLGSKVYSLRKGYMSAGTHQIIFDAKQLPSGLYYYQLTTSLGRYTRSMTLVK